MKFSFTCMNTYRSPEMLSHDFTATPRRLWDPETGKQMVREALNLASIADQEGFDIVSCSEHHYMAGMCNPNAAVFAAALIGVVRRAKIALLGPLVSMNNPVRIAEEIAMLDQLSGGRILALPLRGTPNEYKYYNVPAEETRARTEEGMLLIQKALTEPEPFAWKSTHYDFPVVSVYPGPTQVPHPPLYYSANSEESVVFAAKHGFGAAVSFFGPKAVAERMRLYREQCVLNGWEPGSEQMLFRSFCVVGEDEAHAEDLKARFEPDLRAGLAKIASSPPPTNVDRGMAFGMLQLFGDIDRVAQQIREYHELTGVGIFDLSFNMGYLSFEETAQQIRRFARDVIPQLRDLKAVPA